MASRHRFLVDGEEHTVIVDRDGDDVTVSIDDDDPVVVDVTSSGATGVFSILVDGSPCTAFVSRHANGFEVTVNGRRFSITRPSGGGRRRGQVGGLEDPPGKILAPLAGVVVEVRVNVDDSIDSGQSLIVIEAMKMQNELRTPYNGVVTAVHVQPGDRAEKGDLLLEYDSDDSE